MTKELIAYFAKGGKVTKCPTRIAKGANMKQLDHRTFRHILRTERLG